MIFCNRSLATVAGVTTLVLSWLLIGFAVTEVARALGGTALTERLFPARSAHLLEEAHLQEYSPLQDPAFLSPVLLTATLPFFLAAFVAARFHPGSRGRAFGVSSLLIAAGLQLLLSRETIDPGFPSAIRLAGLLQVVLAAGSAVLGVGLGRLQKNPRRDERAA